jgi:hypothetical protein
LFLLFATGVVDTSCKFTASVVDTSGNLPPDTLTPAANVPPVSTTPAVPVANLLLVANLFPVLLMPLVHLDSLISSKKLTLP